MICFTIITCAASVMIRLPEWFPVLQGLSTFAEREEMGPEVPMTPADKNDLLYFEWKVSECQATRLEAAHARRVRTPPGGC